MIRIAKPRRMGWTWHVSRMGGLRNANKILVGKPQWKKPIGRQVYTWEDKIKIDLKGNRVGLFGMD
jgi:hypothetical protein